MFCSGRILAVLYFAGELFQPGSRDYDKRGYMKNTVYNSNFPAVVYPENTGTARDRFMGGREGCCNARRDKLENVGSAS